jgi:hypothetical protein
MRKIKYTSFKDKQAQFEMEKKNLSIIAGLEKLVKSYQKKLETKEKDLECLKQIILELKQQRDQ